MSLKSFVTFMLTDPITPEVHAAIRKANRSKNRAVDRFYGELKLGVCSSSGLCLLVGLVLAVTDRLYPSLRFVMSGLGVVYLTAGISFVLHAAGLLYVCRIGPVYTRYFAEEESQK